MPYTLTTTETKPRTTAEVQSANSTRSTAAERHEISSLVETLNRSSHQIQRFIGVAGGLVIAWIAMKFVISFTPSPWDDSVIQGWSMALLVFGCTLIALAHRRLDVAKSGEEQERTLLQLQEISETDPLALEKAVPQLRRLARPWSLTYATNHKTARRVLEQVAQARSGSWNLPIAHAPASETADDLPRPA